MITDLVQMQRLGERQRKENMRLRAWMKRHNFVEKRFKAIAQAAEDAIDCTKCANCCRVATTEISERDAERLARYMGLKLPEFLRDYTVLTADEGRILRRNDNGCVFLEQNRCSVYEARPQTCALFPHLVKGNGSLLSRMWHMPDRAVYCPIVFNTLEQFKAEIGFRRAQRVRMRAAIQQGNSPALWVAGLTPRPSCASFSKAGRDLASTAEEAK